MNFFSEVNMQMQILILAIFGAVFGSFVSLVTYRVASKEPMILARSKCPHCKKTLKLRSLIPIFSWIFQGGKCLFCQHHISPRYLAIEFVTMTGFLMSYLALGLKFDAKLLIHLAIFVVLMIMVVVDLEHYFIPDFTQYILAFLAFILIVSNNNNQFGSALNALKPAILYLGFGFAVWVFFYFSAGIDGLG
ncbi:MAG: prepilin peptidase, partial [Alphaproteobacteria bacterium]